mgnify:CR=1 FL=1
MVCLGGCGARHLPHRQQLQPHDRRRRPALLGAVRHGRDAVAAHPQERVPDGGHVAHDGSGGDGAQGDGRAGGVAVGRQRQGHGAQLGHLGFEGWDTEGGEQVGRVSHTGLPAAPAGHGIVTARQKTKLVVQPGP